MAVWSQGSTEEVLLDTKDLEVEEQSLDGVQCKMYLDDSPTRVKAVTDPRDGRRVALKKLPNVFQSLVSSKRVFRELKMLCFFEHDNVLSALDILQPPHVDFFQEMYPFYLFV
ncbi:hypothetical protein KQX54_017724 [Cotesia glomerata]|uniref:Uncharacterized protein n=1 Tax=Cotesia glomerata TaxID=32391 RepID=A0AAV7IZL6_COTGL|nr:hypothetical protein KQX54_017724 [Cotesia glomerata]